MMVGIHASPATLGLGSVGATLGLPAVGVAAIVRRWARTRPFVRSLRAARIERLPAALASAARDAGLGGQVDLVAGSRPIAFVYGLRHPRVCVSTGLVGALDPTELRAVLLHEHVHQARRDPLRLLLGHGLATMLFWLPLARDLYEHVRVLGEVEADAAVAQFPSGRAALAGALAKMLDTSTAVNAGGSYAISGLSVTERRIDALLDGTRRPHLGTSPGRWVPSVVALAALLCLLLL
jgi:Zn-dependent protease with chaperone function